MQSTVPFYPSPKTNSATTANHLSPWCSAQSITADLNSASANPWAGYRDKIGQLAQSLQPADTASTDDLEPVKTKSIETLIEQSDFFSPSQGQKISELYHSSDRAGNLMDFIGNESNIIAQTNRGYPAHIMELPPVERKRAMALEQELGLSHSTEELVANMTDAVAIRQNAQKLMDKGMSLEKALEKASAQVKTLGRFGKGFLQILSELDEGSMLVIESRKWTDEDGKVVLCLLYKEDGQYVYRKTTVEAGDYEMPEADEVSGLEFPVGTRMSLLKACRPEVARLRAERIRKAFRLNVETPLYMELDNGESGYIFDGTDDKYQYFNCTKQRLPEYEDNPSVRLRINTNGVQFWDKGLGLSSRDIEEKLFTPKNADKKTKSATSETSRGEIKIYLSKQTAQNGVINIWVNGRRACSLPASGAQVLAECNLVFPMGTTLREGWNGIEATESTFKNLAAIIERLTHGQGLDKISNPDALYESLRTVIIDTFDGIENEHYRLKLLDRLDRHILSTKQKGQLFIPNKAAYRALKDALPGVRFSDSVTTDTYNNINRTFLPLGAEQKENLGVSKGIKICYGRLPEGMNIVSGIDSGRAWVIVSERLLAYPTIAGKAIARELEALPTFKVEADTRYNNNTWLQRNLEKDTVLLNAPGYWGTHIIESTFDALGENGKLEKIATHKKTGTDEIKTVNVLIPANTDFLSSVPYSLFAGPDCIIDFDSISIKDGEDELVKDEDYVIDADQNTVTFTKSGEYELSYNMTVYQTIDLPENVGHKPLPQNELNDMDFMWDGLARAYWRVLWKLGPKTFMDGVGRRIRQQKGQESENDDMRQILMGLSDRQKLKVIADFMHRTMIYDDNHEYFFNGRSWVSTLTEHIKTDKRGRMGMVCNGTALYFYMLARTLEIPCVYDAVENLSLGKVLSKAPAHALCRAKIDGKWESIETTALVPHRLPKLSLTLNPKVIKILSGLIGIGFIAFLIIRKLTEHPAFTYLEIKEKTDVQSITQPILEQTSNEPNLLPFLLLIGSALLLIWAVPNLIRLLKSGGGNQGQSQNRRKLFSSAEDNNFLQNIRMNMHSHAHSDKTPLSRDPLLDRHLHECYLYVDGANNVVGQGNKIKYAPKGSRAISISYFKKLKSSDRVFICMEETAEKKWIDHIYDSHTQRIIKSLDSNTQLSNSGKDAYFRNWDTFFDETTNELSLINIQTGEIVTETLNNTVANTVHWYDGFGILKQTQGFNNIIIFSDDKKTLGEYPMPKEDLKGVVNGRYLISFGRTATKVGYLDISKPGSKWQYLDMPEGCYLDSFNSATGTGVFEASGGLIRVGSIDFDKGEIVMGGSFESLNTFDEIDYTQLLNGQILTLNGLYSNDGTLIRKFEPAGNFTCPIKTKNMDHDITPAYDNNFNYINLYLVGRRHDSELIIEDNRTGQIKIIHLPFYPNHNVIGTSFMIQSPYIAFPDRSIPNKTFVLDMEHPEKGPVQFDNYIYGSIIPDLENATGENNLTKGASFNGLKIEDDRYEDIVFSAKRNKYTPFQKWLVLHGALSLKYPSRITKTMNYVFRHYDPAIAEALAYILHSDDSFMVSARLDRALELLLILGPEQAQRLTAASKNPETEPSFIDWLKDRTKYKHPNPIVQSEWELFVDVILGQVKMDLAPGQDASTKYFSASARLGANKMDSSFAGTSLGTFIAAVRDRNIKFKDAFTQEFGSDTGTDIYESLLDEGIIASDSSQNSRADVLERLESMGTSRPELERIRRTIATAKAFDLNPDFSISDVNSYLEWFKNKASAAFRKLTNKYHATATKTTATQDHRGYVFIREWIQNARRIALQNRQDTSSVPVINVRSYKEEENWIVSVTNPVESPEAVLSMAKTFEYLLNPDASTARKSAYLQDMGKAVADGVFGVGFFTSFARRGSIIRVRAGDGRKAFEVVLRPVYNDNSEDLQDIIVESIEELDAEFRGTTMQMVQKIKQDSDEDESVSMLTVLREQNSMEQMLRLYCGAVEDVEIRWNDRHVNNVNLSEDGGLKTVSSYEWVDNGAKKKVEILEGDEYRRITADRLVVDLMKSKESTMLQYFPNIPEEIRQELWKRRITLNFGLGTVLPTQSRTGVVSSKGREIPVDAIEKVIMDWAVKNYKNGTLALPGFVSYEQLKDNPFSMDMSLTNEQRKWLAFKPLDGSRSLGEIIKERKEEYYAQMSQKHQMANDFKALNPAFYLMEQEFIRIYTDMARSFDLDNISSVSLSYFSLKRFSEMLTTLVCATNEEERIKAAQNIVVFMAKSMHLNYGSDSRYRILDNTLTCVEHLTQLARTMQTNTVIRIQEMNDALKSDLCPELLDISAYPVDALAGQYDKGNLFHALYNNDSSAMNCLCSYMNASGLGQPGLLAWLEHSMERLFALERHKVNTANTVNDEASALEAISSAA